MSEDMSPSWRSLASAASRSLKGYIAQQRELKQSYPSSRGGVTPQQASAEGSSSKKQSWSQWAGQKFRRGSQGEYDVSGDRLLLFPGWATRRYREPRKDPQEDAPFDVDVFVSGYACKITGVGFNTRAGRAFLRLAKSFASLPKLPTANGGAPESAQLSKSTEDLLARTHLPPLPDEITEESEIEALDDRLRRLECDAQSVDSGRSGPDALSVMSSDSHSSRTPSSATSHSHSGSGSGYGYTQDYVPSPPASAPATSSASSDLQRWHANLEARLFPFWSSALSSRTVRVSMFARDPALYDGGSTEGSTSSESSVSPEKQPILTREAVTAVDGSFQIKFSIPWELMCVHPGALHIAFGGPDLEQDLFVLAELLAPPSPGSSTPQGQSRPIPPPYTPVTTSNSISIPLTHSTVRVISDIDDTIKLSGIMSGARAVFHNVFVKDLRDSVIRGMGDWYMSMWKRGVRFHYVSNGPFELLPVVNEFLQISQLPPGSVRLRSYGGRSLFNGLLSAPAMRKRAGVLDVLNHFPDARFFLVGDSGEQDLELYAEFARERPDQILGIFIRDAAVGVRPLDDPTGADAASQGLDGGGGTPGSAPAAGGVRGMGRKLTARYAPGRSMSDAMASAASSSTLKPSRTYSGSELPGPVPGVSASPTYGYFDSRSSSGSGSGSGGGGAGSLTHSPITEEPSASPDMGMDGPSSYPPPGFARPRPSPSTGEWRDTTGRWQQQQNAKQQPSPTSSSQGMSDVERKRWDLQTRVWRARLEVPPHIPIRIFREPEECVEVDEILDRLQVRGR